MNIQEIINNPFLITIIGVLICFFGFNFLLDPIYNIFDSIIFIINKFVFNKLIPPLKGWAETEMIKKFEKRIERYKELIELIKD